MLAPAAEAQFANDVTRIAQASPLRKYAIKLAGDQDLAEDLVQATVMRALEAKHQFEPGTNLDGWMFTILRNLFYGLMRKRKREVSDSDGIHAATLAQPANQEHHIHLLQVLGAINRLPRHLRRPIRLVVILGNSYEETASICQIPVGTVKSQVHRARNKLAGTIAGDLVREDDVVLKGRPGPAARTPPIIMVDMFHDAPNPAAMKAWCLKKNASPCGKCGHTVRTKHGACAACYGPVDYQRAIGRRQ